MINSELPLSDLKKIVQDEINLKKFDKALHLIDLGFTLFPCNPELRQLLLQLPPHRVTYTNKRDSEARQSAKQFFKVLINSFPELSINSILEIGAGQGSWVSEAIDFFNASKKNSLGIDGKWAQQWFPNDVPFAGIDLSMPEILNECVSGKKYDLGICVEVCEHLSTVSAKKVVDALASQCSVVIFGAALTGQFGQGHQNCRSHYYWANLFLKRSYLCFDIFRSKLWTDLLVKPWYAQNTYLFAPKGLMKSSFFNNQFFDEIHPAVANNGMIRNKLSDAKIQNLHHLMT